MLTTAEQNHARWVAEEAARSSHPQAEPTMSIERPMSMYGLSTQMYDTLDREAARVAGSLSLLNLKMKLAAELERELFMVRYNRWYRRLWRYIQARYWDLRYD